MANDLLVQWHFGLVMVELSSVPRLTEQRQELVLDRATKLELR